MRAAPYLAGTENMPPTKTHHPKHAKKASAGGVGGRRKPKARAKRPRPDEPDEDDSDEDIFGEHHGGGDCEADLRRGERSRPR